MKITLIPMLTLMIFSALITSCSTHKNMQASTAPVQKTKPDSIIINRPEDRNITKRNNRQQTETITASVPPVIKEEFKKAHSEATDVVWSKKTSFAGSTNNALTTYKAVFVSNNKSNWIIYSENGELIEERQEIKTDQLPQNVYNAIKQKYPDSDIVLATTYKHLKQDGSYYALIVPLSGVEKKEIELILRENGSFVQ